MLRKILSTEDALIIHGAHGGHGWLMSRERSVLSYTHAVYSIEVVGKLFVFHAFIDIPSSLVETKLIFAEVQRALRSIFLGGQSKLSTEDTEDTDHRNLNGC